ncbi:predicted protein [Micromonas commoda]|uniref:Protein kinase domain-containing protein n=1 Tax=Micromonas commoda (strain RCC299 / NOUM17 / CCMP2709) TaxID=296587 RepID=C1EAZ6_MICCC|nr:predicted protein [Micromonas commoda]ACO65294.1 predicted protein [Micromonas commoda]|eukprot:XP_002504036.1 predicted protein [Micromonas commoda]
MSTMSATLMPSHRVFGPAVPALRPQRATGGHRRARGVAVRVTAMGAKYKRTDVEVARQIGEGSFGVVYQGKIDARRAGDVVLKRPKLTVEGAAELQEVEAWMNDRVTRDARGSCADFLGSFRVTPDESYLNQSEGVIAKEGLWLVWKFEGDRTLAQYMAQPDYPAGIAKALLNRDGSSRGDPAVELEVTQAVMRQLFKNLASVHRAGLVHRDIKPHNLVLTNTDVTGEREPRFKIIDLGACACFRTGMNFAPDETIMDPKYAPPEEFLIPSDDAPDIRKLFGPVALAAGSAAWVQHKPDRFDMYSAGVVMMQLALPSLRTNSGLITFNRSLKRCGYDLFLWRDLNRGQLSRSKTAVLDAGDGAGWDLARALLRPRSYDEDAWAAAQVSAERTSSKSSKNSFSPDEEEEEEDDPYARLMDANGERPSAEEAMRHRFFSVDPAEVAALVASQTKSVTYNGRLGSMGGIFGLFGGGRENSGRDGDASDPSDDLDAADELLEERSVLSDMLGLEKRISKQQDLIAKQSTTIMRLRQEGAPKEEVEKEQRTLEKMNIGLQSLLRAFSFSQVEAKTTMIKAATEIQAELDDAGVKDDKPDALRGFMRNIFGKRASEAAYGAADVALDAVLDILKPERTNGGNKDKAQSTSSRASKKEMLSESMKQAREGAPIKNKRGGSADEDDSDEDDAAARDPAELRRRMDDIKLEMVAVAEQMAEMERRLLAQQADLERRQRDLESSAVSGGGTGLDDFVSEAADDDRIVKTLKPSGASMRTDIENIEQTKQEIQDALSRIDKMQKDREDLL